MRSIVAILFLFSMTVTCVAQQAQFLACKDAVDPDMAISECSKLIESTDNSGARHRGYALRGYAYYKKGLYDQAIGDFSQAINDAQPAWLSSQKVAPDGYLWRGFILHLKGDNAAAIRDIDVNIARFPRDPDGYYARGLALEGLGRADWALSSYRQALEIKKKARTLPTWPWRMSIDWPMLDGRVAILDSQEAARQAATVETDTPAAILRRDLYGGKTAEAEKMLSQYTIDHPGDQEGFYALGVGQLVGAAERLGQSLYRFGLESPEGGLVRQLPFLRFPVPSNPQPEKLTYEDVRAMLKTFIADLATAEASLAKVESPEVTLAINVGQVRLDLKGDGKAGPDEALWKLLSRVSAQSLNETNAKHLMLHFDAGDAAWMVGYTHMLRAMSEFILAYDWHTGFDYTFHGFFPKSGLPFSKLDELRPKRANPLYVDIIDLVTFIHLAHWPVVEPERMVGALHHLESMAAMSRLSWKRILAETDDDYEWIPNPAQTGALPALRTDQRLIDSWLAVIGQLEDLLQGKTLLGHWRLSQGINLRRVFLEPTTFDPILWLQGAAALPYLEEGKVADAGTWRNLRRVFGGNFFRYAIWFN